MKKFNAPIMEIQMLVPEDVFTSSDCTVEALGCTSCYCVATICDDYTCNPHSEGPCDTHW